MTKREMEVILDKIQRLEKQYDIRPDCSILGQIEALKWVRSVFG